MIFPMAMMMVLASLLAGRLCSGSIGDYLKRQVMFMPPQCLAMSGLEGVFMVMCMTFAHWGVMPPKARHGMAL